MEKKEKKEKKEICKRFNDRVREISKKLDDLKMDVDSLMLREEFEHDYGNDVPKLNKIINETTVELNDLKRQNAHLNAELEKVWKPK